MLDATSARFAPGVGILAGALVGLIWGVGVVSAQAPTQTPTPTPTPTPAMTSSPSSMGIAALVERHLDWLGGRERVRTLRSIYLSGRLRAAGFEGTITLRMRRPDRLHMQYELGPLRGTEALDGEGGWRSNEIGQIEELGLESQVAHGWSLDSIFSLSLLGESGLPAVSLGREAKDGKEWDVVRLGETDRDHRDLFLDPEYGGLVWTRAVDDGDTSWIETTDWRADHGLRLPFRVRQMYEQEARNSAIEWTNVVLEHPMPDELFHQPSSGRKVGRIENDAASTGWIPIERYRERWVYLHGKVNGTETEIVLDSGAAMTVLDQSFAERIGLELTGSVAAQGVGGNTEASIVDSIDITLGSAHFDGLTAAVLDLSGVARALGRPLPVILGKEAFHAFVVDLDYPGNRIAFHDPDRFTYAGDGHELALLPDEGGHKLIRVSVEGLAETEFKLDTGSGGTLTIFPHYTEAHHLLDGRRVSDARAGGVGGGLVVSVGMLERMEIAGFELRDVPVTFFPGGKGAFDTERHQGNLGAGVLSRFRVLFDYGHDLLRLEPGAEWETPFRRDRLGLFIEGRPEGALVTHVATGSPAANAGIAVGAVLVTLDGRPFRESAPGMLWEVAGGEPGGVVTVSDAEGREYRLERRDYF